MQKISTGASAGKPCRAVSVMARQGKIENSFFTFSRKSDKLEKKEEVDVCGKRFLLPLALCLVLSGFSGCSTVAEYASQTPSAPVVSADPLPAPEWGDQIYQTAISVEGRETPVFSPEYRLPYIKNAAGIPSYEAVNAYYATALEDLKTAAAELSGWAVDDCKVSLSSNTPFFGYEDTEEYEIALQAKGIVSILRSHYSNMGGPSPTLYPVGDTFHLATGTRLSFADLFTCASETAAQQVLQAVLEQNAKAEYMNTVIDEESLRLSYQPEQFYLTEEALTVYYPEGELAGALGSPTFAVPYAELEDIWALWD